jgi:hypothetical protein
MYIIDNKGSLKRKIRRISLFYFYKKCSVERRVYSVKLRLLK